MRFRKPRLRVKKKTFEQSEKCEKSEKANFLEIQVQQAISQILRGDQKVLPI